MVIEIFTSYINMINSICMKPGKFSFCKTNLKNNNYTNIECKQI